jgi:hypothetical protein
MGDAMGAYITDALNMALDRFDQLIWAVNRCADALEKSNQMKEASE